MEKSQNVPAVDFGKFHSSRAGFLLILTIFVFKANGIRIDFFPWASLKKRSSTQGILNSIPPSKKWTLTNDKHFCKLSALFLPTASLSSVPPMHLKKSGFFPLCSQSGSEFLT